MLERIEEQETRRSRIKTLMREFGLNISQFAERADINQANLSAMLNGNRTIGEGIINKICMSFDMINKEWLLGGEISPMLKVDNRAVANTGTISGSVITGDSNYIEDKDAKILLLEKEVEHLKELLAEKERFIQALLKK